MAASCTGTRADRVEAESRVWGSVLEGVVIEACEVWGVGSWSSII